MSIIKKDPDDNRIVPSEMYRDLKPAVKGVVTLGFVWGAARIARGTLKLAKRAINLAPTVAASADAAREIIVQEAEATPPARRVRAGFVRVTFREKRTDADGQTTEDEVSFTVEYAEGDSHE